MTQLYIIMLQTGVSIYNLPESIKTLPQQGPIYFLWMKCLLLGHPLISWSHWLGTGYVTEVWCCACASLSAETLREEV